ncbi:hypothetical protein DGN16_00005 [Xanthomonas citri pv. fuscans]|uniref:Uncharacterized protein n=1 Tax=Xanthomonas citri pv. phaseoli var. fuscans TaxID=473423 RepID=A0A808FED0_XANCI|nr:hypothetical protein DGN16_00005 [Xanthomonas citri pv. fuscans]QWN09789.1 hypothetical protein DGN11_00005 [Xanthomonas citri pv. fuscans]QWN14008.1 hypothetical protein DGN07_00005 [Xanthomonas citri pv. fuscans]
MDIFGREFGFETFQTAGPSIHQRVIICCWLRRAEKRRARSPVVKRGWTSLAPRAGFSQSYSQGDPQAGGVLIRSKASRVLTGSAHGL